VKMYFFSCRGRQFFYIHLLREGRRIRNNCNLMNERILAFCGEITEPIRTSFPPPMTTFLSNRAIYTSVTCGILL